MKYVAKTTDAKPSDVAGYGKTETLPSFGAPGNGYALATGLWSTPTVDYYGGSAATIVGTPGTDGVVISATNKILHASTVQALFNVNNALTYAVIAKVPLSTQAIMGDSNSGGIYFSLNMISGTTIRALTIAGGASSSDVAAPPNMDTLWTLIFAIATQTTVQAAYYRASTGLVLGPIATRTSNIPGSATNAPILGGHTVGGTPGSTILLSETLLLAPTVPQLVTFCTEAGRLMASLGKTL